MVVSFLQMRLRVAKKKRLDNLSWNLGSLLLDFFRLYGVSFNYGQVGISVRNGGSYFLKEDRGKEWGNANPNRQSLLAIENPDMPELDMGRNSFQMPKIKRAFELVCFCFLLVFIFVFTVVSLYRLTKC